MNLADVTHIKISLVIINSYKQYKWALYPSIKEEYLEEPLY